MKGLKHRKLRGSSDFSRSLDRTLKGLKPWAGAMSARLTGRFGSYLEGIETTYKEKYNLPDLGLDRTLKGLKPSYKNKFFKKLKRLDRTLKGLKRKNNSETIWFTIPSLDRTLKGLKLDSVGFDRLDIFGVWIVP